MEFVKCEAYGCLLIRVNHIRTVILCIYFVNILVVGDKEAVDTFKQEIKKFFNTKEEGPMEEYVGCKVIRKGNNKLHMFQPDTMNKVEKEFGIDVCEIHKYQTPSIPKFAVENFGSDDVLIPSKTQKCFRIAFGKMLFLIKFSHPGISNAIR